jgi:GWxTD domain-containing protein
MRLAAIGGARRGYILGLALLLAGCGKWQRVGSDTGPDPMVVVPQLFDPTATYTAMGLLATGAPLAFVGSLWGLATESPDTTLVVFALSMTNNALSFRRAGQGFEARYRAELVLRQEGSVVARVAAQESVRVGSAEETRRADESVVFQQFLRVPPGVYVAVVTVRDDFGTAVGHAEQTVTLLRIEARGCSALTPVYQVEPRRRRADAPQLLVNPRATVPYGLDSLRLYLESYDVPAGTPVTITASGHTGNQVWTTQAIIEGTQDLATALITIPPEQLPVGQLHLTATVPGCPTSMTTAALVSFSNQWAITNFDEILSLLRYFGQDRAIAKMREADPADRPALWRDFWRATDPNPLTPENEALELYFRRVQEANVRFREAGESGWLSDRGEVFITLGEPDEIFDQSSDLQGPRRIIRWNYLGLRLQLDFTDDTGFGRFRLTPAARAEYQRVLNTIRSRS